MLRLSISSWSIRYSKKRTSLLPLLIGELLYAKPPCVCVRKNVTSSLVKKTESYESYIAFFCELPILIDYTRSCGVVVVLHWCVFFCYKYILLFFLCVYILIFSVYILFYMHSLYIIVIVVCISCPESNPKIRK
jgi:hypothetical protein